MSKRRKFSAEFKHGAVEQTKQSCVSCAQVARELEIWENLLTRWKRSAPGRWSGASKCSAGEGVNGKRSGFNALEGREFEGFTHPKIDVGKGFVPDLSQICHREIGAPGGIRTPDQWLRKPLLYPAELRAR